ncbi:hypothetical protein PV04_10229 [Phialophora macrospora]|uniref:Uncharacterized protein n=1 Tax=Phialophora macrospora TaxID=1851006 RepID=A0A0D2F8U6_9EURO|nr:hypothetical protein PV04_10229 [Phialophora macrospora]
MDDPWQALGGLQAAAKYQQFLLSNTPATVSDKKDLLPRTSAKAEEIVSQHTDVVRPADKPSVTSQGAYQYCSVVSFPDSSGASSPKISRARPHVYERRCDGEPTVYRQLSSFPSFDEPIPAEATIEEICIKYPNHIRGSYLNAFIQWRWTATDIYTHLSDKAIQEFKASGTSRTKSFSNRANFLMKRLTAHMNGLSKEQVTALCLGPKIRGCLVDGGEYYGGSKLQGKFHNENAPPIRSFPHRQHKACKGRASTAAAAEKTVTLNGKEYGLWGSPDELDKLNKDIATQWGRQRLCAEEIINADAVYGVSDRRQRNRLILQMTNWPTNASTETFFSFQYVDECPAFISAINDMVGAGVADMLSSFPATDLDIDQQLAIARKSAVHYVLAALAARLARLEDLVATLPPEGLVHGVVDHVLSWNGDVAQGSASLPDAPALSASHSDRDPVMAQEDATGPNDLFANLTFTDVDSSAISSRSMPLRPKICQKRAREEPNQQTRSPKRMKFVKPLISHGVLMDTTSLVDASSNHTSAVVTAASTSAADQSAAQVNAGFASVSIVPDILMMNSRWIDDVSNTYEPLWPGVAAGTTIGLSMSTNIVPEDMPQEAESTAWADRVLQDRTLGTSQSGFSCSAKDVAFTLEVPLEEILGEFNIGDVTGDVRCIEGSNTGAMGVVTHSGAHLEAAMKGDRVREDSANYGGDGDGVVVGPGDNNSDAASWDLPDMIDNDEDWLKEAIQNAIASVMLGLPEPE